MPWSYDLIMKLAAAVVVMAAIVCAGCSPLTAFNALAPDDPGAILLKEDVAYGPLPRQSLNVFAPAERTAGLPVVVVFYGGSWNSGRKEDYAFLGKALAARGMIAIVADYRLVPDVRFPAFLEDGARAVLWAHKNAKQLGGDPNRLFVFGHSAGAYNAVMIALDRRYLGALGSSPDIIRGVAALAGPYDFLPLDLDVTRAAFGQAGDLGETQPINYATGNAPSMFLATGLDDTTVKPRNTQELAARLKRAGATVAVKTYPGIGHVGIMLALSVPLRGNAPVLDDVTHFILAGR